MVKIFVIFANSVKREKNGYTGLCTFIVHNRDLINMRLDLPNTFSYELNLS